MQKTVIRYLFHVHFALQFFRSSSQIVSKERPLRCRREIPVGNQRGRPRGVEAPCRKGYPFLLEICRYSRSVGHIRYYGHMCAAFAFEAKSYFGADHRIFVGNVSPVGFPSLFPWFLALLRIGMRNVCNVRSSHRIGDDRA